MKTLTLWTLKILARYANWEGFWPDMPLEKDGDEKLKMWCGMDYGWSNVDFFLLFLVFGTFLWFSWGKLVKWSLLSRKWGFSVWWRGDGWWWQLERWRKIWRFKHLRSGGLETWELRHWRYKVLLPWADKAASVIKRNIRLRSFLKKEKTLLDVVMQTTPGVLPI